MPHVVGSGTGLQVPVSSVLPGAALVHIPIAPQIWQEGHRLMPQQTPSVQKVLVHSLPSPQVAPLAFLVQPLELQVNGAQEGFGADGVQVLPLHMPLGVNTPLLVSHEAEPQVVPPGTKAQTPVLQVPV